MTKAVLVSLVAVMMASSVSMARGGHGGGYGGGRGHGGGGHHGGGYNGGPSTSADYGDGVLAGVLLSTSALFLSDVTADSNYAVYLNADEDAAEYLALGGEQTPALKQAMNSERKFLAKAQVDASGFSDQDVAYLVMKRAESL
jgi:hypothetical protein